MGMDGKRHALAALPVEKPSSHYTGRDFSSHSSSSTTRGIGKVILS
jgi:hypothetical protein